MEEIFLALTATCSWIYSLHLIRTASGYGAFVVMITEVISHDLILFITLYIIVLMAFSSGFHLLFQRTQQDGYLGIHHTMYSMFQITIQMYDPTTYTNSNLPLPTLGGFIAFIVMSTILMLNIFIAMINSTYQRNMDNKDAQITYAVWSFPRHSLSIIANLTFQHPRNPASGHDPVFGAPAQTQIPGEGPETQYADRSRGEELWLFKPGGRSILFVHRGKQGGSGQRGLSSASLKSPKIKNKK